jgi:hypothetical protein
MFERLFQFADDLAHIQILIKTNIMNNKGIVIKYSYYDL